MATAKQAPARPAPQQDNSVNFGSMDFYTAGFTLPEGDYVWKDLTVKVYAPEPKSGKKVPARLGVMITLAHLSNPAEDLEQFYSMGSKAHESFAPRSDGKGIVPVPGGVGGSLNVSTNWAILLKSMYDCGLPQSIFTNDLSVFEGIHAHMAQVAEPEERKGFQTATGEAAEERQNKTILVVTEIKEDGKPWEGTGGIPEGAQAPVVSTQSPKPNGADPAVQAEDDLETIAQNAIYSVLKENAAGCPKLILRTGTFKAVGNKELANRVVNTYFASDAELGRILGGLGYKLVGPNVKPV